MEIYKAQESVKKAARCATDKAKIPQWTKKLKTTAMMDNTLKENKDI
jgi:hypothetical protein